MKQKIFEFGQLRKLTNEVEDLRIWTVEKMNREQEKMSGKKS